MKDLLKCSLDELLTERQNAIELGNIDRYRECNELIDTLNIKYQDSMQSALDSNLMKAYGKLTTLLNLAHQSGLINTKQLTELDANLEQLRLGNNTANIKVLD